MNSSLSDRLSAISQSDSFRTKAAGHTRMILLAEKIYGRRKDLGLSQDELAERSGSTQRIISQLEHAAYAPVQGIGEELYDKLANALEIEREYLMSDKIDRKTFELLSYIGRKLDWKWDIMQFMKLPYFVDLAATEKLGFQISNFSYVRYEYGPFDKKIYAYRALFEQATFDVRYSYIQDFLAIIEDTLNAVPAQNGDALKKLSYETKPMQSLHATLGGKEGWGKQLVLVS
jgi:transcriptional regulator with XRE-family HTH domain